MTVQSSSPSFSIRTVHPGEAAILFNLVMALADYEKLTHEVTGNANALEQHLFGEHSCVEAILAEVAGNPVGFALFFVNYSTGLTQPKLYLEDLFVHPDYRGYGIGKALLSHLAELSIARNYGRMEWSVLDWNQPAIGFYQRIGAKILEDVRICRLVGEPLSQLASLPFDLPATLRPAVLADQAHIFALVKANIEHDGHLAWAQLSGRSAQLAEHLFGHSYAEVMIVEQDAQPVGLALFCTSYSTFLTRPGLFIEDLFVLPAYRQRGMGKLLLAGLAQQVIDRGYGRLEWRVRTWNQPAIDFYQKLEAQVLPDWRICQMEQDAMTALVTPQTAEHS